MLALAFRVILGCGLIGAALGAAVGIVQVSLRPEGLGQ